MFDDSKLNSGRESKGSRVIIVLILSVVGLLLGIVALCIAFSITTSQLQSDVSSLQEQLATDALFSVGDSQELEALFEEVYLNVSEQGNELMQSISSVESQILQEINSTGEQISLAFDSRIDLLMQNFSSFINTSAFENELEQVEFNFLIEQLSSDLNSRIDEVFSNLTVSNQQLSSDLNSKIDDVFERVDAVSSNLVELSSKVERFHPGSCASFSSSSPSGSYYLHDFDGSREEVYCDMTLSCGGITGGWMRVVQLDMTNDSQQCPSPLAQRAESTPRTCIVPFTSGGCSEVTFPVISQGYSMVCGRIIGYQVGSPDAFSSGGSNPLIEGSFFDGVTLLYGDPLQHIWTFVSDIDEVREYPLLLCECNGDNRTIFSAPPSFVGDNYFCDTGNGGSIVNGDIIFSDDPLWDGAGCGPQNGCCAFNSPPWFHRELDSPSTDDIIMRVCRNEGRGNEDIAIQFVEILVQ